MSTRIAGACIGVVFGVTLSWSGMSDPDVIRGALLFDDSYLFLMFASAVIVAAAGLRLLRRTQRRALLTGAPLTCAVERPARRHVAGSVLFGAGWGIAGACPGPILTQIGQGVPWALLTAVGMVAGVYLFLRRHQPETEPAADATTSDVTLAYQH